MPQEDFYSQQILHTLLLSRCLCREWKLWRGGMGNGICGDQKKRRAGGDQKNSSLTGNQIEDTLVSIHGDESIDETIRTVHEYMMKPLGTAHTTVARFNSAAVTARLRPQPPVEPPPGWVGSERAKIPIGMSPNLEQAKVAKRVRESIATKASSRTRQHHQHSQPHRGVRCTTKKR